MSYTIIVTGGCGYIGSHIARAFKRSNLNNKVYIIDRVLRNHTTKDIDGVFVNDYASSAALDIIKRLQPDIIVHCAGTSLVGPSINNPSEYYDNNVSKTVTLLNFIKDLPKLPIILFSSSAAVYGNPDTVPIPENHKLNPISPYGNTKLIIELLLKDYHTAYGINSACFRYFNAAGAWINEFNLGQEPGATHIIAKALEASIARTEFTINGNNFLTIDGTAVRDYIHVNDIADAHIDAVEYLENNSGFHIFNLGTNSGISNKEIANYINTNYGLKNIIFGEHRKGDPAVLIADSTNAKTKLNWDPQFSDIDIIIDSAYKWYKTIHQI